MVEQARISRSMALSQAAPRGMSTLSIHNHTPHSRSVVANCSTNALSARE
jgi:hypothetical protein